MLRFPFDSCWMRIRMKSCHQEFSCSLERKIWHVEKWREIDKAYSSYKNTVNEQWFRCYLDGWGSFVEGVIDSIKPAGSWKSCCLFYFVFVFTHVVSCVRQVKFWWSGIPNSAAPSFQPLRRWVSYYCMYDTLKRWGWLKRSKKRRKRF